MHIAKEKERQKKRRVQVKDREKKCHNGGSGQHPQGAIENVVCDVNGGRKRSGDKAMGCG